MSNHFVKHDSLNGGIKGELVVLILNNETWQDW
jgi:hypothetical protein